MSKSKSRSARWAAACAAVEAALQELEDLRTERAYRRSLVRQGNLPGNLASPALGEVAHQTGEPLCNVNHT